MEQKHKWIFQRNNVGYEFWDTYMHNDCEYVKSQPFSPFNTITTNNTAGTHGQNKNN